MPNEIPDWAQQLTPAPSSPVEEIELASAPRERTQYDEAFETMRPGRTGELMTLAMLVQPPQFMRGGPGHVSPEGLWVTRSCSFDLMGAINNRIAELGSNAQKVFAYPNSHSTLVEQQHFIHSSFEDQMKRFR